MSDLPEHHRHSVDCTCLVCDVARKEAAQEDCTHNWTYTGADENQDYDYRCVNCQIRARTCEICSGSGEDLNTDDQCQSCEGNGYIIEDP